MSSANPAVTQESHVTLGCFQVGDNVYALDVSNVREVVRWQPITPLPKAPELIDGVIDLRGMIVPVIDLGRALTGRAIEPSVDTRIAVADVDGLLMGLIVDAAIEVLPVELSDLDAPPALVTQAGYDVARAVVRRADASPILVLSLDHVLESVYRSTLVSPEEAS